MTEDRRSVFIIDGMNLFLRSFSAYPTMSSHGYQMGGCVGFLKTMQRLCREYQPIRVYIAWEGGGSSRRRKLYPEYKMGRKPAKLNRFYGDDIPESEENRQHQLVSLLNIVKSIPVCQIYVSDCEADDIVAYLARGPLKTKDKIIISSDKDLYQLIDERTKIYSLYKKRFVTESLLQEEFGVSSSNFGIAKCLCGDDSDNIPGVKGAGFKTVASRFPMLRGEQVILQDVINYAASHQGDAALYKKVFESSDIVKRNWQLVHLDGSMLSHDQSNRIEHAVDTFRPKVDKMTFVRSLIKEGVNDFDADSFFYDLGCIEGVR